MSARARARVSAAAVALVVALFALQAAASAVGPSGPAETVDALERAGFAYAYGLRVYAAAVIWGRIDPLYHEYYADKPLTDQVELLPRVRLVQLLDPQFEQAYYIGAWVIAKRGDVPTGLEIARSGVENNPRSGLLHASLAQMLLVFGKDAEGARRQVDLAVRTPGLGWSNDADRYETLATFASIYEITGRPDIAEAYRAELARMRATLSEEELGGDHDHDGDGEPDH